MSLNKEQKSAINHNTGPAIVLAGPGSGKTTVITMRAKNLIEKFHVDSSKILVITFTKMAANEMRERFHRIMDSNQASVTFGTYHAVFFTILKHAYHYSAKNIIREEQQRNIIKKSILKYEIEIEDENELISSLLGEIGKVKNNGIDLNVYYSTVCPEDIFRKIFMDYQRELSKEKYLDFDDMLVYCYELLDKRKDILAAWQNKFQYILIDEFQDINKVQYDIIKLLSAKTRNIFIVGDDDQSIYGFRGANPEIMFEFTRDFKDAARYNLNVNYRSTANIVNSARSVIDHNSKRFPKDLSTVNKEGNKVRLHSFTNVSEENQYIIKLIDGYVKSGISYPDIAVLTRTNIGARQLISRFIEYNIPFTARDVIPSLYEHWICRHIFTYIRMALGSRERSDFLQIMNKPRRYISRDSVTGKTIDFEELRRIYEEKTWMVERIDDLENDLLFLNKMNPFSAINYIRRSVGYDDYLQEYAEEKNINAEELMNIISELHEESREFLTYEEWFEYIREYTKKLNEQAGEREKETKGIRISTMHSSKGLEYKVVIIIDANEGVIPYSKSLLDSQIEEERRMFYVAMTRAKEDLHILYTKERYNKKQEVSRFVKEISGLYVVND